MDQLKDVWASMLAHINERTTNPFTFSFAASWAAWNYRFLVVLFSAESPAKTFAQIDAIYASGWARWGSGLVGPLLTALAYVYLYPYWTQKVVRFYRSRQIAIANAVKLEEGNRLMRPDEVSQIVRLHESDLRAAREELTVTQQLVAQLRNTLAIEEERVKNEAKVALPNSEVTEEVTAGEGTGPSEKTTVATPIEDERVFYESKGPGGGVIKVRQRHFAVLTVLAEMKAGPSRVSTFTKLRKYWVDESITDLMQLGFIRKDSEGSYSATDVGRDFLRRAIAEGHWKVPA